MEATKIRLRPILMTTSAMIFGVLPLLLASGAGAVSRFDMGLVIAAGLLFGTVCTLFVVPVMYTYLAADHRFDNINLQKLIGNNINFTRSYAELTVNKK